ncbi:hypothetical protein BV25DRAFT_1282703 [Artomyces pyxidatus]|uniref:Uncharacterized protein n=1 Tax=Artomyces pyxidatus TaxID=48021 RepID=A0ACB8SR65_9AGAM|nr:hypothetical protein BV25DRAFT_1282703 [Artomyces pyxidatus]
MCWGEEGGAVRWRTSMLGRDVLQDWPGDVIDWAAPRPLLDVTLPRPTGKNPAIAAARRPPLSVHNVLHHPSSLWSSRIRIGLVLRWASYTFILLLLAGLSAYADHRSRTALTTGRFSRLCCRVHVGSRRLWFLLRATYEPLIYTTHFQMSMCADMAVLYEGIHAPTRMNAPSISFLVKLTGYPHQKPRLLTPFTRPSDPLIMREPILQGRSADPARCHKYAARLEACTRSPRSKHAPQKLPALPYSTHSSLIPPPSSTLPSLAMDNKQSSLTLSGNTVPFPAAPSISRQLSGLTLEDLESLGYSYPVAYSRLARDSFTIHRSRQARSPAGSTYSYRPRAGTQQLSPVVEETENRTSVAMTLSAVPSPSSPSPQAHFSAPPDPDDTFFEEISFAMMTMMPSPRLETRRNAVRRRRAKRSRVRETVSTAKRVAGATGRAVSALCRALTCPPWARHR